MKRVLIAVLCGVSVLTGCFGETEGYRPTDASVGSAELFGCPRNTGGVPGSGGAGGSGGVGTGGANTGGAIADTGGANSGGAPGTGGTAGIVGFGGAGGDVTTAILWRDSIQTTSSGGFDEVLVEKPKDTEIVSNNDALGGSLTRVTDPTGIGMAFRHYCVFDNPGCRAELGLWSFQNAAFGKQAKSAEGIWVAQEMYFPAALKATNSDETPWINIWDWHSTDNVAGANRWHTSPGLMLAEDGSMRVRWEWGAGAEPINVVSPWSSVALPIGRWVDVEMHYQWSTNATLELWIDGQLALRQTGAKTRRTSHTVVETYSKWYGAQNDGQPWSPSPAVRYTRNVRVAGARIWPVR